ncbi:hypothetical protein [Arsenophonus nasoniae]|uniref:Uncharacterized protein n=1 Tax=Arsenophonus nasoniae TaxID=638 RepID=A0AA95GVW1_9GAMM|nr:hypothetical protein [Arsenophonus nasoniae]WGM03720.1 hypothetical protein QE210_20075 [Arsenophonus nasoniae]
MKYYYLVLDTEKTNTQTNYRSASKILRANGLTPFKYCTQKSRYMQPTVFIFNADGEKLGFIQESVSGSPAFLTTYKKMK